jgi:hypothetical protein
MNGHAAEPAYPAGELHCAVPLTDVPEMRRSGLMQARALAFLIPEDGVDPKLIDEWRAKIICACALDVQFRKAFFAELPPSDGKDRSTGGSIAQTIP